MPDPNNYPACYTINNLKKDFALESIELKEINKRLYEIFFKFEKYAKNLDFVTDNIKIDINPGFSRRFYVVDKKLVEIFYDSINPELIFGGGPQPAGIFFKGDKESAKKLHHGLEEYLSLKLD